MGRPKTIDRQGVLDAAESVIATDGAGGLTFEAVAKAAGVTKGGVQSCFGTKEALIEALLERWGTTYDADVARLAGPGATAEARVHAHIQTTAQADDSSSARSAALVATLLQSPQHLQWVRKWYAARFSELDAVDEPAALNARLAFLATEGLFFLRHFGLMPMSRQAWDRSFADIEHLVTTKRIRRTVKKKVRS